MSKINLIVELNHSAKLEKASENVKMGAVSGLTDKSVLKSNLFSLDTEFGTVEIPNIISKQADKEADVIASARYESSGEFKMDASHGNSTYIVRGEVDKKDLEAFEDEMAKDKNVVGVYADVAIEPQLICPGSAAVGNSAKVEELLCVSNMKAKGMTGKGVHVAIVDTGINIAYLNTKGKHPAFNAAWSWKPTTSTITPGSAPVSHGTMCSYDVCIAAPECTLLDIALLTSRATGPTAMSGLLSDAIKAYEHLINFISRPKRPGENSSLVVNNSWGMFHQSWDYPVGHAGNFSHNPNHPFNLIVKKLSLLGADILFAAGNCGPECPDGRCMGVTSGGIYGSNSSPYVTSVAGVATNLDRVGYSNKGPGCLTNKKPDITGYTHFSGSGVYAADGGTSAACPVVSGVFAAIRTKRPFDSASAITSPDSIRNLVTSTAKDLGASGWDYFYGYGVVNGCKIVDKMYPRWISICMRYPKICELLRKDERRYLDICKRYPVICRSMERERLIIPKDLQIDDTYDGEVTGSVSETDLTGILDFLELSLGGSVDAENDESQLIPYSAKKEDCNCGCK